MNSAIPASASDPSVGLAYSSAAHAFIDTHRNAVDHVEIPFELLRHDPRVLAVRDLVPVILHCASLSIAGTEACSEQTISDIQMWVERSATPWIGEHLAFVTASRRQASVPYAPGEPYNIGYTVSPVMNEDMVISVSRALINYGRRFAVPMIIENSPVYFAAPGTTLVQSRFISEICESSGAGLLLDLAHHLITTRVAQIDPISELEKLPLERVVEIHLSGIDEQSDGMWDDHATPASALLYSLLDRVLQRVRPRAVTLEYNWSSRFSHSFFSKELARVRQICRMARK